MTTQLLIEFWPETKARRKDPATSKDAAKAAKSLLEGHWKEILDCLKDCGAMGKDKIAQYSSLDPNQVARRMKELQKAGLVELTGELVESNSGRMEREWRIVTKE